MTKSLDKEGTATRDGAVLMVVDIVLMVVWILMRKASLTSTTTLNNLISSSTSKLGIFGQPSNYLYICLILVLFGVNIYRMRQRSLFPASWPHSSSPAP